MITESGSITAVLKLQTTNFTEGLEYANTALDKFEKNVLQAGKNSVVMENGIRTLTTGLDTLIPSLNSFNKLTTNVNNFNKFANGVNRISIGLAELGKDTVNAEQSINVLNNIMKAWQNTINGTEIKIKNLSVSEKGLTNSTNQAISRQQQLQQQLANLRNSGDSTASTLLRIARAFDSEDASIMRVTNAMTQYSVGATNVARTNEQLLAGMMRSSQSMQQNAVSILRNLGYTGRLSAENKILASSETQVASSANQASNSLERQAASANKTSASLNKTATQASKLRSVLSGLRSVGMLVGSMLAYNFVHHLGQATNQSIQAKSEMEGYFKMLNYGQKDIQNFNKALDETVHRFQRVNKYSLGETISSIGVEFDLTTQEMVKAMDVTSMITSEYLRAGRNANEASLAVKDVLQGQFQRLSRETGVGKEELQEAGWDGDPLNTNSLLDSLRKVGESRHWDVFAEKANSLNDIVTILQNRFGEWSADMVNMVQPHIVGAFNSIMSFGQGLSESLSGMWKWLNTDGWGQTAVKIGLVSGAILTLMPLLTSVRSGATLLQVANMSLTQSLGALVFGLKAETLATFTSGEALAMKLLGINSEEAAETGLIATINGMILTRQGETLATTQAATANVGFVGGLYAMITGEALAEGATIGLSGAIGLLTGAFLTSPIGWFTLAILGLASAFYVLTGGLDESWDKMKQFNQIMEDPHSTIQPYRDEVTRLTNELNEAKDKYGENSDKVKDLQKDLDSAKESLDNVNSSVQHGVYWNEEYKKSFEGIDVEIDKITRKKLGDLGVSDEDIDKVSELADVMDTGADKEYHALQVLHRQQSNYYNGLDDLTNKLKEAKIEGQDAVNAQADYAKHSADLMKHSAIANSSEDWWEWGWNSLYAGLDQLWIDLDDAKIRFGKWLNVDMPKSLIDSGEELGKMWDGAGQWFSDSLSNIQFSINDWLGDAWSSLDDSWGDLTEMWDNNIKQPLIDWWNGLFNSGESWSGMKKIDISWFLQQLFNIGDSVDFSWATTFINDSVVVPLSNAWNDFIENPLAYLSAATGIGGLINLLLGVSGESVDFSWATTFINDNIVVPLATGWNLFMSDPLSFIGGFLSYSGLGGLLSALTGNDDGTSVWTWVNNSIITPMRTGIANGIAGIPIIGNIAQMLGLVPQQDQNAYNQGYNLIDQFKQGVEKKIGEIPIVGDIARMLGLIPQQNDNAHNKGYGVGDNIKRGEAQGHKGTAQNVRDEMWDVVNAISSKAQDVFNAGAKIGQQIWDGINSILDRHSPGMPSREIGKEFGVDIPDAINNSGATAYSSAQSYAQSMYDGMNSVANTGFGLEGMVGEYESDAQTIAYSSQMMGNDTTTAFNNMQMSVNQSTNQMTGNVTTSYTSMQQKQASLLNNMKTSNTSAYNEMYNKSNQSLLQMRTSTENVTLQMTNAWKHMKDQIVSSANKLKTESTSHFNTLSSTIGSFYRKIQNPSNWGAGIPRYSNKARRPTVGKTAAKHITSTNKHGAGANPYLNSQPISLHDLLNMTGMKDTTKVDLNTFLASIYGEHGFGWNDWNPTHYNYIKNTSDQWSMKPPMIMGYIPAGNGYTVGEFEGGQPKLSWSSFMSTAESLFSTIPYRFYWDSEWKGDWVSALKAGATNCSDGTDALIALANTYGFSGSKVHTTTRSGLGHFYAIINGRKMDTTNFQHNRSWTPLGAGIPTKAYGRSMKGAGQVQGKTVNVTVDMSNSTIYGVDDLDSRIQEGVQKGLQEEFNDPYTVAI